MSDRFAFGRNWLRYFDHFLDEKGKTDAARIDVAMRSLAEKLPTLPGKRFLDIGCGSGLMSLAAQRLGATVHSFDYDPHSVKCTQLMRGSYGQEKDWTIERGSVLSREFLKRLGEFDVVYSWGVLHHTGDLWRACNYVIPNVKPGGLLWIAIYNDQGWRSRYWRLVKRLYNHDPSLKGLMVFLHLPLLLARYAVRAVTGRLNIERGMSLWFDYNDWLGGYPFEVATHDKVVSFYTHSGFTLRSSTRATSGCNEFVFERI